MQNNMLETALQYQKMGFSVIPCRQDKKPYIKWEEFQKRIASEDEIRAWWQKWPDANVGIVTGIISNLAVIDIDTDEGKHAIQEFLPEDLHTPICNTPKGGNHIYFRCPDDKLANNARIIPGCDLRANGGYVLAPPSCNGNGKSYSWISGRSFEEAELAPLPEAYLRAIKSEHLKSLNSINSLVLNDGVYEGGADSTGLTFAAGTRDNDIFHVANCLAKGGMPDAEILKTLEKVALSCNPPFPLDELQSKVISAIRRKEHREMNVSEEVRRYIALTSGEFSVKDCYIQLNALNIVKDVKSSEKLRVTIRQVLHNLSSSNKKTKEPMIEPAGKQDGRYRRIDDRAEPIDWQSADSKPLKLKLPLGLSEYVSIYPGNIIVFAGESNSGKTALSLNIAKDNALQFAVDYFSSEMGPQELKTRLVKFTDVSPDIWNKVRFMERTSNFADVINGDRLTIIDFLEVVTDFYQIAALLFEIHKKMKQGACIVNLQKSRGTDFGRGGQLGLEKPRLYCALESGKIKIIKAKAWAKDGINPNGLQNKFKLVQGSKFVNATGWHREGEIK